MLILLAFPYITSHFNTTTNRRKQIHYCNQLLSVELSKRLSQFEHKSVFLIAILIFREHAHIHETSALITRIEMT